MAGGLAVWAQTPPEEREPLERVQQLVLGFEDGIGREVHDRADRLWRLYRGFKRYRSAVAELVHENDRDVALKEAADNYFGSNLHIPYAYATVETMIARALANRPRSLVLPRKSIWTPNAQGMQTLVDTQHSNIDIELLWEDVMRDGFLFGLGTGKVYWRREWALRRRVKQRMLMPGKFVLGRLERELIFDDPDFDCVDPVDMGWDQFAPSYAEAGWIYQRMWMSTAQVMERLQSGFWNTGSAATLTEDDVRSLASPMRWDEARLERLTTAGFTRAQAQGDIRGDHIHEVIEFHDGHLVHTMLDRQVLVQVGENPCVGHKPYLDYTPTPQRGMVVGIGEIEPIESLSRELDTLRSMQLDAGVLALLAGYAFDSAAIDREDLEWGPNAAIEVTGARPQDAIMPLPRPELPSSSYQNAQQIMADIERVTGVNDALAGGDGGSISTATEAQLVQASLSKRVERKSRRFEVQICKRTGRLFIKLNQRMILESRDVRLPPDPAMQELDAERQQDPYAGADVSRWQWVQLSPADLMGDFEYELEGGLAAENVPQNRADAQAWLQLSNDPRLDSRTVMLKVIRLMGEKDPETFLAKPGPVIPPSFLDSLAKAGVPQPLIDRLLQASQRAEPMLRPQTDQAIAEQQGTAA